MVCSIAYDITRLASRVFNRTPNGIDRVDFAFARHFVGSDRDACQGLLLTLLGPRSLPGESACGIVDLIADHWGETASSEGDRVYRRIVAWLGGSTSADTAAERIVQGRSGRMGAVTGWVARHGVPIGRSPVAALPQGSVYVNVSQFPLWVAGYFRWLKQRPDVKPVFFIHDLLPLEVPEYFRKGEYWRHQRRLENLARFGAGAIVTTDVVRGALTRHLAQLGRGDMPILVAPTPVAPIFSRRETVDPELSMHPYFIVCGTIEPRKNHLLLLQIWRELVRRDGAAAPKLIVIGTRGWENENVVDLLDRCRTIGDHVIEVSGLSTPSFKRLLDGARALLMPSFAEGYGLPVAEALAAGVPAIVSDLDVFREIGGELMTAISPIDGEKWLETIRAFARSPQSEPRAAVPALGNGACAADEEGYFSNIETFLGGL